MNGLLAWVLFTCSFRLSTRSQNTKFCPISESFQVLDYENCTEGVTGLQIRIASGISTDDVVGLLFFLIDALDRGIGFFFLVVGLFGFIFVG